MVSKKPRKRRAHTKTSLRKRSFSRRLTERTEEAPLQDEALAPTEGGVKPPELVTELKGAARIEPTRNPGAGGEPKNLPEPPATFPTREQATTQPPNAIRKELVLGRRGAAPR